MCVPSLSWKDLFGERSYGIINCDQLFELLTLLAPVFAVDGQIETDFLKILFVESRNDDPDLECIVQWANTRLNFTLEFYFADMLVRYVRLYRSCGENVSEYDAFERARRQRPLHIPTKNKKAWSMRLHRLIAQAKKNVFIERRRQSISLAGKLHSFSFSRSIADRFRRTPKVTPSDSMHIEDISSSRLSAGSVDIHNLQKRRLTSPLSTPVNLYKLQSSEQQNNYSPDSTPPATRNTSCTFDGTCKDNFEFLG
mmetsp:Transcript_12498/g.18880  ORF Transcript_12498/g.18880 Transcript_12498/m.18880 type:complete len:254 (-) Transcript_12498:244-1005(-)